MRRKTNRQLQNDTEDKINRQGQYISHYKYILYVQESMNMLREDMEEIKKDPNWSSRD